MSDQYNLDDYLSSRSNSNDRVVSPINEKSKSVSQSYNITDEDIQYFKNLNNSKLNDKVSLSSVGSTKTIDSIKRPSENFLESFMSTSNMMKSSSSIYHMNKSPPRPRSPGKHNGFMMTSQNLLAHDTKDQKGSFELFESHDNEEPFMNIVSSTATPMLIPDNTTSYSKETIIIEKPKEFMEPSRTSTGTSDNSDLVMSHKSQPSTTITDQASEDTKDNKLYNSQSNSSIGVILSPYEENESLKDDMNTSQDAADASNQTIDAEEINSKARYMFQCNNYMDNYNSQKVKSFSSGNKLEDGQIPTISDNTLQYYQMTPSQRLRYRREQSKNKVKHTAYYKEYVYDSLETYEKNYYKHGNIYAKKPPTITANSDSMVPKKVINQYQNNANNINNLIWNVPVSSTAVMNMNFNNNNVSKKENPKTSSISPTNSAMPMTPVHGISSRKELIDGFNQTSLSLTDLYLLEMQKQNREKINERLRESEHLPSVVREATEEGLDEARFVSKEKLNSISSSRPSWLPVKESKENQKHEKEIYRTVSNLSIEKMNLNKKFSNLSTTVMEMLMKNNKLLKGSGSKETKMISSSSVLSTVTKNIFEYPFIGNMDNRLEVYERVLMGDIYKVDVFENTKLGLKAFKGTDYKNERIDESLYKAIKEVLSHYDGKVNELNSLHTVKEKIPDYLLHLTHLKKKYDGDADLKTAIVLYELLLRSYGLTELQFEDMESSENQGEIDYLIKKIWEIEQLISKVCFSEVVRDKYNDRIMNKRGLVSQMMKLEYGFASEFDKKNLNFDNFISTLVKLPNKLSLWALDIIVLSNGVSMNNSNFDYYYKDKLMGKYHNEFDKSKEKVVSYWTNKYMKNNYKILVSLTLNILLNYHFGYDDFNELREISALNYNLLGLSNRSIIDVLTSQVSASYNAGLTHRNLSLNQFSSMNTSNNSPRRLSKLNMRPNSVASMSRSSSHSHFMELTSKPSVRSSQLMNEVTDAASNDELSGLSIESIDFMNLVTLDLMGMRMYSCTDEDEDDYVSMEGFVNKWHSYYKKL